MLISGSCSVHNMNYSGCCLWLKSPPCSNTGCYCDQNCHNANDCCHNIADIGCRPAFSSSPIVSPIPTNTVDKMKRIRNTLVIVFMKKFKTQTICYC